jgi:hypothetical protein
MVGTEFVMLLELQFTVPLSGSDGINVNEPLSIIEEGES